MLSAETGRKGNCQCEGEERREERNTSRRKRCLEGKRDRVQRERKRDREGQRLEKVGGVVVVKMIGE